MVDRSKKNKTHPATREATHLTTLQLIDILDRVDRDTAKLLIDNGEYQVWYNMCKQLQWLLLAGHVDQLTLPQLQFVFYQRARTSLFSKGVHVNG